MSEPLSRRDKDRLRKRECSFCGGRLDRAAMGHCAAMFMPPDGSRCGWVRAFEAFGIDEALRIAKLPCAERPPLPP